MQVRSNKSLASKLERVTGVSGQALTEDAIVRSRVFQAVLEQAKALAEEASQVEELKSKLADTTAKLQQT